MLPTFFRETEIEE